MPTHQKPQNKANKNHTPTPSTTHQPKKGLSSATIQQAGQSADGLSPHEVLQLQRSLGNQAVNQLLGHTVQRTPVETSSTGAQGPQIQRLAGELEQKADQAIKDPVSLGAAKLVELHRELMSEYSLNEDYEAGMKGFQLGQAMEKKAIEIIRPFIKPLLTTIQNRLTLRFGNDTPEWITQLSEITIMEGEGIAGGMSVGQDTIFIVPSTGIELLLGGSLSFSIAHEIGHLVSKGIDSANWGGMLKTNQEIEESGVDVDSTEKNKGAKFEEIRADLFGAAMVAAHLGVQPSQLDLRDVEGGIDAPQDAEHPSFDERKAMLKKFHGMNL